jgi:spore maturation protein CgeB
LLDAIQACISKPIEEIKVGKKGYAEVIKYSEQYAKDLRTLVLEHDAWLERNQKRKKKRKKQ